jgi:hypothetical protein
MVQLVQKDLFSLGDIKKLKDFIYNHLEQITLKRTAGIVLQWIELMPKRHANYHRMRPADVPDHKSPPWWPRHVQYTESGRLPKKGASKLRTYVSN